MAVPCGDALPMVLDLYWLTIFPKAGAQSAIRIFHGSLPIGEIANPSSLVFRLIGKIAHADSRALPTIKISYINIAVGKDKDPLAVYTISGNAAAFNISRPAVQLQNQAWVLSVERSPPPISFLRRPVGKNFHPGAVGAVIDPVSLIITPVREVTNTPSISGSVPKFAHIPGAAWIEHNAIPLQAIAANALALKGQSGRKEKDPDEGEVFHKFSFGI